VRFLCRAFISKLRVFPRPAVPAGPQDSWTTIDPYCLQDRISQNRLGEMEDTRVSPPLCNFRFNSDAWTSL
jgi:hypothetical protein